MFTFNDILFAVQMAYDRFYISKLSVWHANCLLTIPVSKHGFSSNDYCYFDFFNNSVICLSRDMHRHRPSTCILNFIFLILLAHWPTCFLSFPIQPVVNVLMLFNAPCNIFLIPAVLPITAHELEPRPPIYKNNAKPWPSYSVRYDQQAHRHKYMTDYKLSHKT